MLSRVNGERSIGVDDYSKVDKTAEIYNACVHPDVTIGARTKVWQFASILHGAVIGDDCVIGAYATVDGSRLGNRVHVGAGAQVHPGMLIEDDVFVGPGAIMCNDPWPRVNRHGWLDVADLVSGKVVVTRVMSGASIGAGALLLPGVTVGIGAMVAAGAVVDKDVGNGFLWQRDGVSVWAEEEKRLAKRARFIACFT